MSSKNARLDRIQKVLDMINQQEESLIKKKGEISKQLETLRKEAAERKKELLREGKNPMEDAKIRRLLTLSIMTQKTADLIDSVTLTKMMEGTKLIRKMTALQLNQNVLNENLNNNSIENKYLPKKKNNNNNNNTRSNTVCNKLGRCFSRFTRKTVEKKKEGGKRRNNRTKKQY
jgi:hypothetical protein